MSVRFGAMTSAQQQTHHEFWLAWVERAQAELGALLAETIDVTPAVSDTVYECVNQLIDVEQQLSAVLSPKPQHKSFTWTRVAPGRWSSNGYEILRDRPEDEWRVLKAGQLWDAYRSLIDAKRSCERDFGNRQVKDDDNQTSAVGSMLVRLTPKGEG